MISPAIGPAAGELAELLLRCRCGKQLASVHVGWGAAGVELRGHDALHDVEAWRFGWCQGDQDVRLRFRCSGARCRTDLLAKASTLARLADERRRWGSFRWAEAPVSGLARRVAARSFEPRPTRAIWRCDLVEGEDL